MNADKKTGTIVVCMCVRVCELTRAGAGGGTGDALGAGVYDGIDFEGHASPVAN